MKKILVIKPGNTSYKPSDLDAMIERIRDTLYNDGFILLSSVRDKCEVIEIDDVMIKNQKEPAMTDNEKIYYLLTDSINPVHRAFMSNKEIKDLADYLIDNGVTVKESEG